MSDINVVSITCPSCGAALEVPKMKTKTFCTYCGNPVVIENLNKNAEIKKKGDINSGFPFKLNDPMLHSLLASCIGGNVYSPADIYQEIKVLAVDKVVAPAYYIFCNGTLNFTYDLGMPRERQRVEKRGDSLYTVTETYTEWIPQNSVAQEVRGFFAPANNAQAEIISKLFEDANANNLIDIEALELPDEAEFIDNDLPVTVAFGTYVKPVMDEILEDKAIRSLSGRTYRNVAPGGSTVMKDQEVRVALTYYVIKFEYQDKLYKVYCNNDATGFHVPELPVDEARVQAVRAKEAERDAIKSGTGLLTTGFVFSIIFTVIGFFAGVGNCSGGSGWAVLWFFIFVIAVGGIVVTSIFRSKKNKIAADKRAVVQAQIDEMLAIVPNAEAAFRAGMVPFKGYFEPLAGNPAAFQTY